jgi:type VI protein secretion system component Hcp
MAWSNIFLQLMTGAGPIVGEGLLEGWEYAIELEGFDWSADYEKAHEAPKKGGLAGAIGGAVAGALGLGGKNVKMSALTFTKRFDIASSQIHFCIDKNLPVMAATITVLYIRHGGQAIHMPGFSLVATDGYFRDVGVTMSPTSNGVEVKEKVTLEFKSIAITYMKKWGKSTVPTNPFIYEAPD